MVLKRMNGLNLRIAILFICCASLAKAQNSPSTFRNPILAGFSPDPTICRVGDDYYLANSSFVWFPAIPIYHSKDLVNWKLVGHGISNPNLLKFEGLRDRAGIWAVTMRYHDGLFYLITTASESGGNFYITAKKPEGPWSDPIWLKDAQGIDPSLFWDDDGKCYYTGNSWDFKKSWAGQCAIWIQELDLQQKKLVGERKILTYGHANNAAYAEGPHLYKIKGRYLLLSSEGGTDQFHAITAHHSKTIWGPYLSDKTNPVLSHRQFGSKNPLQAIGHGDLVETQNGEWWATVLGKRMVNGEVPLSRETFLTKVEFEDGTPIFNPGFGKVLFTQERPNLPWSPFPEQTTKDQFETPTLDPIWHTVRSPKVQSYQLINGYFNLKIQPQIVDSLVNAALYIQKIKHHQFYASTKMDFTTTKDNEQAGLIIYRTNENYYCLLKAKTKLVLIKKFNGKKEVIATIPYTKSSVHFAAKGNNLDVEFSFGETIEKMIPIGIKQSLIVIAESNVNKFNGPGIGMYATSNGQSSTNKAKYDWFEYKEN